ncbi:transcriptional regulator, GntR family [Clostridium amylolyticum]|uniref:Transcriptional regulator, GntR family n=1 Tax=Clostridium amylolyticum TaxID=1121298 RepID=A0A1M6BZ66_9CLOT|nr:GntR family transcriptional regulator [Clostridium amylolyticum]SHI53784.1 transcriptional regulator, GntR family [Clostridium amylolyticum]
MVDKNSTVPIYIQIEDFIKKNIQEGVYLSGQPLPTERELTELLGVSRMTVRQAISNLVHEGVLYRIRSKGAYVSKQIIEKKMEIESFSEDMKKRGLAPSSKLLSFEEILPDEDIRAKLKLSKNDKIYFLNRLRLANDEPMAIEYCYIPKKYFPDIKKYNLVECSLYKIMKEEYSVKFNYMRQKIKAVDISKRDAEILLDKPKGFGLVSLKIVFDEHENPVEYTETIFNPERYYFDMIIFDNN